MKKINFQSYLMKYSKHLGHFFFLNFQTKSFLTCALNAYTAVNGLVKKDKLLYSMGA